MDHRANIREVAANIFDELRRDELLHLTRLRLGKPSQSLSNIANTYQAPYNNCRKRRLKRDICDVRLKIPDKYAIDHVALHDKIERIGYAAGHQAGHARHLNSRPPAIKSAQLS